MPPSISACHRCRWLRGERGGGEKTKTRRIEGRAVEVGRADEQYCGQVSAIAPTPRVRARATSSADCQDETWTMVMRAPVISAKASARCVASRSIVSLWATTW